MRLRFNEAKATQAAALLLKRRGGRMKYIKLIKLLYLADREALLRWGRPVTTDHHASLDHGPIVRDTYNLIVHEPGPNDQSFWRRHIATVEEWDVCLRNDPSDDELSQAEEDLLNEIFDLHGHKNRWLIVDETHNLPEWKDPHGSSIPIRFTDILRGANVPQDDVMAIRDELRSLAAAEDIFTPA